MRFSIIAVVAAFSSTALAQGLLDQIPACAQTCFGSNLGTCGVADIACICGSSAINDVSCCVFSSCSQSDIEATTQFAVQLCRLQNIDVNTQPTCPSGSATPSADSSSGASATDSASMTASGNASMTSGTASMTSGSASMASGSTSMASGGASATSASAAGSTAAAPLQTAGAGVGLGLAMFGLLAAL